MKRFKHLNYEQRREIERLLQKKIGVYKIADIIGVTPHTIYNEIKRGQYQRIDSELVYHTAYSADIAQQDYNYKATAKGAPLKIGNNHKLAAEIEYLIIEKKYSPYHVIKALNCPFCRATLYSYIDKGIFARLTNRDLHYKSRMKKKKAKSVKEIKPSRYGVCIDNRPDDVNNRSPFNWEMDLVIGKRTKDKCLLVLTERYSRVELIYPIQNKSAFAVNSVLHKLKDNPHFESVFQSITVDNGSEFAMTEEMEHNRKGKKVTQIYYCHPYCSSERASNENANRLIRRFIPKSTSMKDITRKKCIEIAEYMNNMHRQLHNGSTSKQVFNAISPCPIENFYIL